MREDAQQVLRAALGLSMEDRALVVAELLARMDDAGDQQAMTKSPAQSWSDSTRLRKRRHAVER